MSERKPPSTPLGGLQFSAELRGGLLPEGKCKKKPDPTTPGITVAKADALQAHLDTHIPTTFLYPMTPPLPLIKTSFLALTGPLAPGPGNPPRQTFCCSSRQSLAGGAALVAQATLGRSKEPAIQF